MIPKYVYVHRFVLHQMVVFGNVGVKKGGVNKKGYSHQEWRVSITGRSYLNVVTPKMTERKLRSLNWQGA